MATIKPFKGIYYNPKKIKIENVIAQPYDKIDSKLFKAYKERDPHNAVRLILKSDLSKMSNSKIGYEPQAQLLQQWLKEEIFIQEPEEAFYAYDQEFRVFGEIKHRQALIGLGGLEEYGKGIVFPHEETLSKPKADRLNHLTATQTQFGLIFMLYEDKNYLISKELHIDTSTKMLFDFVDKDDGVRHQLWSVKDQVLTQKITEQMKDKKLLIADGHHRYETALTYRNQMRERFGSLPFSKPYDYAMMAFVNLYDEGLVILPTHRLIRKVSEEAKTQLWSVLKAHFKIDRFKLPKTSQSKFIHEKMTPGHSFKHVIGLCENLDELVLLHYEATVLPQNEINEKHTEAWRRLDVVLLHYLILEKGLGIEEEMVKQEENLFYCRGIDEALESLKLSKAEMVFFLNPTQSESVRDVAFGGERMPQKSTDFYPKLMTGLTLNRMEF
ncbi:MAG: DUF1015 domain-containing protein [Chlamydiae bacterium]|nr:DUF1015 domain-containing protein [Chlamydiota bacterium]MBI3276347.1 DUF1015 domain-containing protein [Chlamydiota bacterium]